MVVQISARKVVHPGHKRLYTCNCIEILCKYFVVCLFKRNKI